MTTGNGDDSESTKRFFFFPFFFSFLSWSGCAWLVSGELRHYLHDLGVCTYRRWVGVVGRGDLDRGGSGGSGGILAEAD